jgi:hypothetical protein
MENSVYEIGQRIGMAKSEIKNTLKRNKKTIIVGAVIVVAVAFAGNLYYLGVHYGGISWQDFRIFKFLSYLRSLFA